MKNSTKPSIDRKKNFLQEHKTIYGIENNSISNDCEELHPVLEKLLLQSKQDAKDGKGISYVQMMRRV